MLILNPIEFLKYNLTKKNIKYWYLFSDLIKKMNISKKKIDKIFNIIIAHVILNILKLYYK